MGPLKVTRDNLGSMLRPVLLLGSLATYLVSPDEVVWHFVKSNPHARLLEHLAFAIAAVCLGVALFLKVQASRSGRSSLTRTAIVNILEAVGIGSLLPLPGFLLFLFGSLGISLLRNQRQPSRNGRVALDFKDRSKAGALAEHIGLCCAFLSMIVFSIVLMDRVADVLFATSALVSLVAGTRTRLKARPDRS